MDSNTRDCYFKAGKAISLALKKASEICKPGMNLLDFTNQVEQVILDAGCNFGFPLNVSLDSIAAHYSSPIGDTSVIPTHGLLKVDAGAHCNGFLADAAITINLGNDEGVYQTLCAAAKEALDTAISAFRPGHTMHEIGEIIYHIMEKYHVKPISNLGGHKLSQYNLHAGSFVPNIPQPENKTIIEEGDVYAIEPFSTNGFGGIKDGPEIYIYRYKKPRKKNINLADLRIQQQFKDNFHTLPFSPRWIDFIPIAQINHVLKKFVSWEVLDYYPVLVERGHGIVAQFEHTVIVEHDGAVVTTQ